MKNLQLTSLAGLALALLSTPAAADSLVPGSVLVYPSATTGNVEFTAFSITNSNLAPAQQGLLGGTTTVLLEYVNLTSSAPAPEGDVGLLEPNGNSPHPPKSRRADDGRDDGGFGIGCLLSDVSFSLTPADTKTFLGACTNPFPGGEGYLVVTATDPAQFKAPWSHNYLLGSEFRVTVNGSAFTLPAIAFDAIGPDGQVTDVDGDGQLDFDDVEYQALPDELYVDKVFTGDMEELVLINLTGGASFVANVAFDVFNDNEQPLSATYSFQCWAEERLTDVSLVFDPAFLAINTLDDPADFDVDCDGQGDLETSWARIRGLTAVSSAQVIPDPALLGALTGPAGALGAGRPLWRSLDTQDNGDFLNFGVTDPELGQNAPPVCDAGPPQLGELTLGAILTFDGSASFDPDGTIASYVWDFGDGTQPVLGLPMATHTYLQAGTFTVTLTVTDDQGASSSCTTTADVNVGPTCDAGPDLVAVPGQPVTFDGSGSSDPDGTIVQYDWDFGDGNTALDAGPMPSHAYATAGDFTVTLTVTDDDGSVRSCSTMASVNSPPICDPGPSQTGNVGDVFTFDGTGSADPDGTIVSYDWDFGDGNTGNGPITSHVYAAPGTYVVVMTVTDDDGSSSSCSLTVTVNDFPVCDAGGPYTGQVGVVVAFDGSGSVDPDGTIVQYDWDFGDGTTASNSGPLVNKTYAQPGIYTVVLTVLDDDGAVSACPSTVQILDPPPVCDITGRPSTSVGVSVPFDASGSFDPDGGPIVDYAFDFGDGTPIVSGPSPLVTHAFSAAGVYFVQVTVTDDEGSTSTCGRPIAVQ